MEEAKAERVWATWQMIKTLTISIISGFVIIYIAASTDIPSFVKYLTTTLGIFIIIAGIILAIFKEIKSRIYYCKKCDKKFVPTIKGFFRGNRCPDCNSQVQYLKRDIK